MKKGAVVLKAAVCAFALVGMVFFAGCGKGGDGGGGNKPESLAGQWVVVSAKSFKPGDSGEMELFSDGTAIVKANGMSLSGTWKMVDKRLVMSMNVNGTDVGNVADYKLSGYELTIVDGDGDTTIYVKKEKLEEFKEKQAAAAVAPETANVNNDAASASGGNIDPRLVGGTWYSGKNGCTKWSFGADGKMSLEFECEAYNNVFTAVNGRIKFLNKIDDCDDEGDCKKVEMPGRDYSFSDDGKTLILDKENFTRGGPVSCCPY